MTDRALHHVVVLARPAPGLAMVDFEGDQALWAEAKARKNSTCVLSGDRITIGEKAYRPVGNQSYRAKRIRSDVIESARISVVHASPPKGSGTMPCCGRTPFEVSPEDRITVDSWLVTCGAAATRAVMSTDGEGHDADT